MENVEWRYSVITGFVRSDKVKKDIIDKFRKHGFEIKDSDFGEMKFWEKGNVSYAPIKLENKYGRLIFKTLGCFKIGSVTYKLNAANKCQDFCCFLDFDDPIDITTEDMENYLMFECGALFSGKVIYCENDNSFKVYFYDELEAYMFMKNHNSVHGRGFGVDPKDGWSSDVEEEYEKFIKMVTDDYIVPEENIDAMKKSIPEIYNVSINAAEFLKNKEEYENRESYA